MKGLLSKTRMLLLGLFYTNPERSFYMQEIGRLLGKKPGIFQRALNSLSEEGLLLSEYKGHARFFKANSKHILYPELKRIVAKTVGVEGALRDMLQPLKGIRLAFLYGSFAKSAGRPGSDVDLIVVGDPKEEKLLLRAIAPLEKKLQREINYKLYSIPEFLEKRAKQDPFLSEVLTDKIVALKGALNAV